MEAREYEELVDILQRRLRENGLGSIADVGDVVYDRDSDAYRATAPKDQLIEMLMAFERHLATRDPATIDGALGRINDVLDEGYVEDVLFDPLSDAVEPDLQSLRGGETRRLLREQVADLVRDIQDDLVV